MDEGYSHVAIDHKYIGSGTVLIINSELYLWGIFDLTEVRNVHSTH